MSFFKEFKEFAMKGNVMDLAIGVVVGAAFGKIVTSLVNNIIMPVVTLVTGKINFTDLFIRLDGKTEHIDTLAQAVEDGIPTLNYGAFITNVIDFLIITFVIFIIVKQLNRFRHKPAPSPVTTKTCPYCQTSIHIDAIKCPNCTSSLK